MKTTFLAGITAALLQVSAVSADIQPLSGTWSGSVAFDGQTGCPPEMMAQMQSGQQGYSGEALNFPQPFDPVALEGNDANFMWTKITENVWEGVFSDIQATPFGTLSVVSKSIVVIIAPEKINQVAELSVDLPLGLAQQLGMAGTTCFVGSTVYHTRIGP
ncbi:MAG: hypothetical protein R8G34_22945 [Paracoccaceae bacterium]|nr:hypothetical protein [Paracoccaceae bacterium]